MTLESASSLGTIDKQPRTARRRRWWLAAILSLMVPGLGQLYAICPKRAAWMLAVVTAIHVSLGLILGYEPPDRSETVAAVAILALLIIVIRLYSAADAAFISWYGGTPELRPYNRFSVYLVILVGWTAASHFGLAGARTNGLLWQPYAIVGANMTPTLSPGEGALGWSGYYRDHAPEPGEVALVALESGRKSLYRIVAGPGQRIALTRGEIELDGRVVPREAVDADAGIYREALPDGAHYLVHATAATSSFTLAPTVLPEDSYLVVGDNRDLPTARIVSAAALEGRAYFVIFSRDAARIGTALGP